MVVMDAFSGERRRAEHDLHQTPLRAIGPRLVIFVPCKPETSASKKGGLLDFHSVEGRATHLDVVAVCVGEFRPNFRARFGMSAVCVTTLLHKNVMT